MTPITLKDMVCYYEVLSKIENPSDKIKICIDKLETEIHFALTTMKRMELTNV